MKIKINNKPSEYAMERFACVLGEISEKQIRENNEDIKKIKENYDERK